MNFTARENVSEIIISINYEDKDDFKKLFPAAKWLYNIKCWSIKKTPENIKNLETLKNFVKSEESKELERLNKELEDQKSFDKKIASMQKQIEKNKKTIAKELKTIEEIEESKQLLLEIEDELKKSEEKLQEAQEAKKKAISETTSLIAKLIDINQAKAIYNRLENIYSYRGNQGIAGFLSEPKKEIRQLQASLEKMREKLEEHNFTLEALDILCEMNPNRPDKSSPDSVLPEHWAILTKIEEDD